MKNLRKLLVFVIAISVLLSFNAFAMKKEYNTYKELEPSSPQSETVNEDRSLNYRWTWLDDVLCVQFRTAENARRESIKRQYDTGLLKRWGEYNKENVGVSKIRNTYSGKWSQSAEGIWSFTFDDCTIPVSVTKIDGVLYAFNTYGELKADYEYYDGIKTEADGLVKADSAEFTQWLATQYLPECTSHE